MFHPATVALLGLVLSLLADSAQAAKDKPKCDPNPVFQAFPGTSVLECQQAKFNALKMRRAKEGAKANAEPDSFEKEGQYWYFKTLVDRDSKGAYAVSELEVRRNYENAVLQAKGTVLYSNARNVYYQITRPDGEYWGRVDCDGGNASGCGAILHYMVRVAAMEQSVVVSAEQIAKDMGDGGKVVFYGIYFDTDKASLKAESTPTLAEMAKWLNANPTAKVFIVGHTDLQGSLDRNQKLSRDRALSVIAALTKDHGIKADRLAGDGVGPLAPAASNGSEAGRAKNRRVEMVLR